MAKIIPAILTNNEEEYHQNLLKAEHVADLVQVDVIDGKFADNLTIGCDVIKKYQSSSMLEVQLLVTDPQNYIDDLMFVEHVSRIIIPFEAERGLPEAIYHIKNHNMQTGISLNPSTPVKAAFHFLDDIDFLVLMAVEPGFSGQKFQEQVINKVEEVKRLVPELAVEVDGGVNFETTPRLVRAGANFLAANSVLYKADDFRTAYEKLERLALRT